MSGCIHPIVFADCKTIRANALEYDEILGHSQGKIFYCGRYVFSINELLKIELWDSEQSSKTESFCYRYVIGFQNGFALMGDDDYIELLLSPFKTEVNPLGLSRVRS